MFSHEAENICPNLFNIILISGFIQQITGINTATSNSMQCSETGELCHRTSYLPEDQTIHGAHIEEVHNVPMSIITRPIPPVLNEQKVTSLMETIKVMSYSHQYLLHIFKANYFRVAR